MSGLVGQAGAGPCQRPIGKVDDDLDGRVVEADERHPNALSSTRRAGAFVHDGSVVAALEVLDDPPVVHEVNLAFVAVAFGEEHPHGAIGIARRIDGHDLHALVDRMARHPDEPLMIPVMVNARQWHDRFCRAGSRGQDDQT